MEFEDVSEEVEKKARRVAAAFGVEEWMQMSQPDGCEFRGYLGANGMATWLLTHSGLQLITLSHLELKEGLVFIFSTKSFSPTCKRIPSPEFREFWVRGLYCLSIEDGSALAFLNSPLSAHEKMELRLSLPREFWPQKWLDEERANS